MSYTLAALEGAFLLTGIFFASLYLQEHKIVPIITPIVGAIIGIVVKLIVKHG